MADGAAGSNVDAKLKAQRDELERRKEALLAKRSALSAKSQGGGPSTASSSSSAAAAGTAHKPAVPARAPPVPSRVAPTAAAKQRESGDGSKTSSGKAQASSVVTAGDVEAQQAKAKVQDKVQEVSFSLANFSIKGLFGGTSAATPEEAPAQPKEDEAAIAAATNAQRVEEERLAAEKAAAEKLAEGERVAAAEQKKKAEEERDAAEAKTLEEERIATEKKKIEEERIAAEKAAAEQKAAEERIAAAEEKAEEERVAAANRKKKADEEKIVTSASLASCEAREMSGENQSREWQVERRAMEAKLGDALKAQANAERELASVRKELERESKALADKDAFTEEMGEELVRSRHELDMHLEENEKLRRERDAALLDLEKVADEKKGLADAAASPSEGCADQVLSLKAALSESQAQFLLKSDEAASLASQIETLRSEMQAVKAQSSHALEEAEWQRKEADEKLQAQVAVHAEALRLAKEAEAGKVRDKDESVKRLQEELELAKDELRKGKGEESIAQGLRSQIEELEGALEIARLDLEISAEEKEEAVYAMQVAIEREQAVEDELAARDVQCARLEAMNAGLLQRAAGLEARLGGKAMGEGSPSESQVMADASSAWAVSVEGCRGCEALREESRASSKRSSSLLKMLTSAREELLIAKMILLLQPVDIIGPHARETQDANGKLACCAASIVGFGGLLMLTHSMLSVGEDDVMGGRGRDGAAGEEEGQDGQEERVATRALVSKTLGVWERIMAAAWDGSRKVMESMTRFQGEMQEARKVLLVVCGRGTGGMGQEELERVRECVGFVDRVSQMVKSMLSEDEWSNISLAPQLANLLGFMSCQGQGPEEYGSMLPCGLREKRLELQEEARAQASVKEQLEMRKRELRDMGVLLRDKEEELLALSLRVQMSREAPNAPSNAQAQLSALRSEYETYKKEAEEALEKYAEAEEQRGQRESARSARQGGGSGHRGIAGGDRGHGEALHDAISRMRPAVVNARALRLRQEIMRDLPLLPMPPSSPCSASGIYSKAQRHIDDVDTRLVLAMAAPKIVSLAGEAGQTSGSGLDMHAQLRLGLGALSGLKREVEGLKVGIVAAAAAT